MLRNSLTARLGLTSIVWVVGTLIAAGVLLSLLFRDHIERRFDAMLVGYLEELVAASDIGADGGLRLAWVPVDPRFNRPLSGWYWQIRRGAEVAAESQSVWHGSLDLVPPAATGERRVLTLAGPGARPLRAVAQNITLPDAAAPFTFVIAGPVADIEGDVSSFTSTLIATLVVLGGGLVVAIVLQVRFGLAPLDAMRRALSDIRDGKAERLPETFPREVEPVVRELNALLDHNAALLARARTQAGNLAHSIKNALTVIGNEAKEIGGPHGDVLRGQADALAKGAERYLSRARAGGSVDALGARTPVREVVDDLCFSMDLLFKERQLAISATGLDGLGFRGDRHDLEEMLGNLMDNACKWARREVRVAGARDGDRLVITIDDDGPGISEAERARVLQRGQRLDETMPGSGLGLDIVRDLAELYRGSIALDRSPLGGLSARLALPAAT